MKMRIAVAVVLLLFTATSAFGTATVFFGQDLNGSNTVRLTSYPNADAARTLFFSHLVGVGTETFDSLAPFTTGSIPLTFPGAGTATLNGGSAGTIFSIPGTGTNGFGRYPISGNNYYDVDSNTFTVTFNQPVAAFGFYGIDIGDIGGQLTLQLAGGATELITVPNDKTSAANGSVLYFGFIEPATFTRITFGDSTTADVFGFDNMTVGSLQQVQGVPEPASLMLLGSGLGAIGILRRKLRK